MNWKELGNQLIDRGLPALGAALGGPAGASVGLLLANTFGSTKAEPKEILKQLTLDPNAQIKLLELEKEYELKDKREDNLNTADARSRQVEVTRAGKFDYIPDVLALSIVIGFFVVLYIVNTTTADQSDKDILYIMIGALVAKFSDVYNYYFGSSSGSKLKDEALAKRA